MELSPTIEICNREQRSYVPSCTRALFMCSSILLLRRVRYPSLLSSVVMYTPPTCDSLTLYPSEFGGHPPRRCDNEVVEQID